MRAGQPRDWRPTRGYSWPPAEEGNQLALKHGAFSPRYVDPVVRELVERTLELAAEPGSPVAYLARGEFRLALAAGARCEAICHRLEVGLASQGETLDPESAALHQLDRWTSRAESARARLGRDPASWARLHHELAASEQALAQADAHRELQERYGRPAVVADGE